MNEVKIKYQLAPSTQWPEKYITVTEQEFVDGSWKSKVLYNDLMIDYERVK